MVCGYELYTIIDPIYKISMQHEMPRCWSANNSHYIKYYCFISSYLSSFWQNSEIGLVLYIDVYVLLFSPPPLFMDFVYFFYWLFLVLCVRSNFAEIQRAFVMQYRACVCVCGRAVVRCLIEGNEISFQFLYNFPTKQFMNDCFRIQEQCHLTVANSIGFNTHIR